MLIANEEMVVSLLCLLLPVGIGTSILVWVYLDSALRAAFRERESKELIASGFANYVLTLSMPLWDSRHPEGTSNLNSAFRSHGKFV